MKKDLPLFAGLALLGVGIWFWLKRGNNGRNYSNAGTALAPQRFGLTGGTTAPVVVIPGGSGGGSGGGGTDISGTIKALGSVISGIAGIFKRNPAVPGTAPGRSTLPDVETTPFHSSWSDYQSALASAAADSITFDDPGSGLDAPFDFGPDFSGTQEAYA